MSQTDTQSPAGKRIMVIDDQPIVASLLEYMFQKDGWEIVSCRDPVEAVQSVREIRPDLLTVDIRMPRMNGIDLCRRLREIPETQDVPIIVITGSAQTATADRAREARVDAYVTKPFSPKALAAKIRELLAGVEPDG